MSSLTSGAPFPTEDTSDDSAFFEEETPLTHPRFYSSDHVENLEVFAGDLHQALKTSFPARSNLYTAVHVLLIRWTEDDLGVQSEITALRRVLETQFHFDVEEWHIPSLNPTRTLQSKLYGFQDAHQIETELLIVYYGGHAKADYRRGRSIWQAHCRPDSPFLNWSSLQPLLETAVPHVLIILDCCFAASAARDTTEGTTKEMIAACGRENPTLGVGQRSFTSALIEEMQAFEGAPFTVTMLHSRLVTMRWRLAFTPIYALLSERGGNSITIGPLDRMASVRPDSQLPAELQANDHSQHEQVSDSTDELPSLQPSQEQTEDTRVLLAVSVVQDAIHDVSQWVSWLTTAAPWDVKQVDVQVQSIFKSSSTLILISIPTYAWNRLPERPAYRFVGFIRSENIFQAAKNSTASITETVVGREALPFTPQPSSPSAVDTGMSWLTRDDFALHEAQAIPYPADMEYIVQSDPQAPSLPTPHGRQGTEVVGQPAGKVTRNLPRSPVSGASSSAPRAAHDLKTDLLSDTRQRSTEWPPKNNEQLLQLFQLGIIGPGTEPQYFSAETANTYHKHHKKLTERQRNADDAEDISFERLAKAYNDTRERMWKMIADRVGKKWQDVEAECMERGLGISPVITGHPIPKSTVSSADFHEMDTFEDSAISVSSSRNDLAGHSQSKRPSRREREKEREQAEGGERKRTRIE